MNRILSRVARNDLRGLSHSRGVNPILGVHEQAASAADRGDRGLHLFHDALEHQRLRNLPSDRLGVAFPPEIAGERLLADHVFAGFHRLGDHARVQGRRGADVDDVYAWIRKQRLVVARGFGHAVLASEGRDIVAARGHGDHLDLQSIDAPIGVHVQLGHEAASDQPHSHFRHRFQPSADSADRRRSEVRLALDPWDVIKGC